MIGHLATSRAGHDKDRLYVIVAREGDYYFLCDGDLRPPHKPKKKRIRHVQLIGETVEETLLDKLLAGRKVYAEEIKYALKQYRAK
ncbi:hypothetical protein D7X48_07380 [bacterium D16-50]|jgi:ribosomal protein L14E/L6E/L27E|nr:hypothetical protein [Lachnospiraceae bacterium]RKJ20930.1 hypothetical protein D7X48_07380 [bacterium D16-50]